MVTNIKMSSTTTQHLRRKTKPPNISSRYLHNHEILPVKKHPQIEEIRQMLEYHDTHHRLSAKLLASQKQCLCREIATWGGNRCFCHLRSSESRATGKSLGGNFGFGIRDPPLTNDAFDIGLLYCNNQQKARWKRWLMVNIKSIGETQSARAVVAALVEKSHLGQSITDFLAYLHQGTSGLYTDTRKTLHN